MKKAQRNDYHTKFSPMLIGGLGLVAVILLALAVSAILPKWNEIWYEFGQIIYRMTH